MSSVPASRIGLGWCVSLGLLVLGVAGCSTSHYRKAADKDAARLIAEKSRGVPNMDPRFTIVPTNTLAIEGLPLKTESEDFLGAEQKTEISARVLNLDQALLTAVERSREYQNRKELLYLDALGLALDRHRYTPIFSGRGSGTVQNQPQDVQKAVDQLAGTQTSLLNRDTEVVQQYNVSGRGSVGSSILLRSGATLANSFSIDFLRFLNGDPRFLVRSTLGATLTQPLLRGAGYKATMENLTQSERDLLYSLREFTLYRKDFAVRIAQSYYGVLQARDAAKNEWIGYQSFQVNLKRGRALTEEGRSTKADFGLLEQASLQAEASWITAVRQYKQSLDQFKILLGLSPDSKIVLDDRDLADLKIQHPDLESSDAANVAIATRLDIQTARDRAVDAQRKIKVSANALKPRVDLVVQGSVDNKPNSNNPAAMDVKRAQGSAGLDFDLGLDRMAERNAYRSAEIAALRANRELQLLEDQVKTQVFGDWRSLDEAKRTHRNSELGVNLAERRVEEQELRAELGRSTTRDLVDAQTALVRSRNGRTQALVSHTIARLQFWKDMGILYIKENGKWEDANEFKH